MIFIFFFVLTLSPCTSGIMFLEQQYFIDMAHAAEKEPEFTIYGVEDLPGDNFTNSLGMEFVYIKPGSFMMGSPSDEPKRNNDEKQHQVTLTKAYYIQTTEVTQGQWKAVMGGNPSSFSGCGDNCPVEDVSWNDVQEFIRKLNSQEGDSGYRLPTEAEWEYACRAGSRTALHGRYRHRREVQCPAIGSDSMV